MNKHMPIVEHYILEMMKVKNINNVKGIKLTEESITSESITEQPTPISTITIQPPNNSEPVTIPITDVNNTINITIPSTPTNSQ